MPPDDPHPHLRRLALLLPVAFALCVFAGGLGGTGGLIGHDYRHQLTRLVLGALHFWHDGFSPPHYTPYLCGGIPFFADPQSAFHSLPQVLAFFLDPFLAARLADVAFAVLGYLGAWRLLRHTFSLSPEGAHLGALAFTFNGFIFVALRVGHLTHHGFYLLPWILTPLFETGGPAWRRGARLALPGIYLVWSGGVHVLVITAVALAMLAPAIVVRHRGRMRDLSIVLLVGGGLALAASVGKLAAAWAYAPRFHIPPDVLVRVGREKGFLPDSPLVFLADFFFLWPLIEPPRLAWEWIGGLSWAVPPLFVIALVSERKTGWWRRPVVWATAALVALVLAIGWGGRVHALTPVLGKHHNPTKLLAALIPGAAIALAWIFDRVAASLASPTARTALWTTAVALTLAPLLACFATFAAGGLGSDYPYDPSIPAGIRKNRGAPVTRAITRMPTDEQAPLDGHTSLLCYEPLFGYGHETLHTRVRRGPVAAILGGGYNLNHPGCLVYPKHFRCKPWDRIPASARADFQAFTRGEPAFGVPAWQSALLWLDLAALAAALALALPARKPKPGQARRKRRSKRR